MFKIGDEVEILSSDFLCDYDGIPREKITHGGIPSIGDIGIIKDFHNKYPIVEYDTSSHGLTKLGFKPKHLRLIKTTSIYTIF